MFFLIVVGVFMNKSFKRSSFLLCATFLLFCAIFSACSADESSDANVVKPDEGFSAGTPRTIVGFVNRGQFDLGARVVLREVDSTLNLTGVAYHSDVMDPSGFFSFEDVKLSQPYVYLEVNGSANSLCYDSGTNPSKIRGNVEAYADLRKGDTISMNVLTHFQAKRLKRYIDRGLSFDSSMSLLQKEISDLLLLDTLREDFNKLNLSTEQGDNYYLLGVSVLDESFMYSSQTLDKKLEEEVLTDSLFTSFWGMAYAFSQGKTCYKYKEYSKKYNYTAGLTSGRKYLDNLWQKKYNLGPCSAENYKEIKAAAYNSEVFLYCDTSGWTNPKNGCYDLDKMYFTSIVADTLVLPGELIKGKYCKDAYYRSDKEVGWTQVNEIAAGLGFACVDETVGRYGKSGRKCYRCSVSYSYYWEEVDENECSK